MISGSARDLQQILVNLCVNAEHAVRKVDAPAIAVTRHVDHTDDGIDTAVLTVQDNGTGAGHDLKALQRRGYVVTTSHDGREVSPEGPRGSNVVEVVQKPISVNTLVEIITRTLGTRDVGR